MMLNARYATPQEIKHWNELILHNPDGGTVFATHEYAEIKRLTRYTPRFIIIGSTAVTVLEKKTPPFGSLWYLPKGPGVTTAKQLIDTLAALKPLARKAHVFAIRIESELDASVAPTLARHGLRRAAPIIPSASTITLDISASEDTLIASLPQKGRHAIRRAQRDGVTVSAVPATNKNCKRMYKLLSETADGQFGIRSFDYYQTYWQTFAEHGLGQLFFAEYNGKIVAGAYALVFGSKSTYKDGASIRERTAYGASHALQWEVIRWAKSKGALLHDFCGSPPKSEINNTDHPHYGIGRFKLSFSKNVVDYIGCYDAVIAQTRYTAWLRFGERFYRHYYYKRTGDYFY